MKVLSFLFIFCISFIFTRATSAKELPVPFTSQAPHGHWSQPWQDACEEAAVVMVDLFYAKDTERAIGVSKAAEQILRTYRIKTNAFGYSVDENADKITALINTYYIWEARRTEEPTIEDIKKEIDAERPVIVPAHGRSLLNPYFRDGGPEYHMFVISGYDEERKEFIVQEPGTRRGLDFRYPYDRVMSAMHDFVPNRTRTGAKVAIFTSPVVNQSADLDGDNDGLTKAEELRHGTVLWLRDSDGDGYSDGDEVRYGYLPTVPEQRLPSGSLVKAASQTEVYYLENGSKRHIANEKSFVSRRYRWENIRTVSKKFLDTLWDGSKIE